MKELDTIYIRDNPHITRNQHKSKMFRNTQFHQNKLVLNGNSCIVDSKGDVLVQLFKNVVSEYLLELLEIAATRCNQPKAISDVRGAHSCVKFGSYIERGGKGRIWTRKEGKPERSDFIREIAPVGEFVSNFFGLICPEVAYCVGVVPMIHKLWEFISLMFWNVTTINKLHVDVRDLDWCLVLPFGKFSGGEIDLQYLNSKVLAQRGDLYLLRSNRVYHNVYPCTTRQSLVFTNHRSVIQRFTVIDTQNILS